MKEKLVEMKDVFHFDKPGTLPKPGPVGRFVRLGLGIGLGAIVWTLVFVTNPNVMKQPGLWFWAVFTAMLAPYVVNIGWGRSFGALPRFIFIGAVTTAAGIGYVLEQTFYSNTLWWTLNLSMVYVLGHLAVSFVISSIIATPGCEMRGLPHLFGLLSGKATQEHYCPGPIDALDRWELGVPDETASSESKNRDWLASGKSKLVVYGIPFVLIQIVGNLAGLQAVTWTWGLGFGLPGIFCIINALRCKRVHCYFVGPILLTAGVMTFLMGFDVIDFGRSQYTYLLNITILAVIVLYTGSERIWGAYFGNKDTPNETDAS